MIGICSRARSWLSCLALCLVTLLGLAANPVSAQPIGKVSSPLNVATATVWNGPVSVCWEFSGRDSDKAVVRQAIANTWEQQSSARFTGWGACNSTHTNIRIAIQDDAAKNPHTIGLGRQLDNAGSGMILDFEFKNWSSSCSKDEPTRLSCIRSVAVHEFGHALGFSHEQNRADGACEQQPQGGNGNEVVGIPDLSSVMNYCNPKWNNNGQLSAIDVIGVRQFYGPPPGVRSPAPPGSYAQTCNPREADGTTLFATCRAKNGVWWKTSLTQYRSCTSDIANVDGRLDCVARPLPPGSYRQVCRDMVVDQDVLSGSCKDRGGTWRRTQLGGISSCRGDIGDEDGVLSCNRTAASAAPPGSYQRSCVSLTVINGVLHASCQPKAGPNISTMLRFAPCRGDISNNDGMLRCNNGLPVPPGSYLQVCTNAFNDSGRLSAWCKAKNQRWWPTSLDDFASCKGDIGDADSQLTCRK